MLKTFLKQIDGQTISIVGSLLGLTIFAIVTINYFFVDRLLLDDAETLTETVADRIKEELFSRPTIAGATFSNKIFSVIHDDKTLNKALFQLSENIFSKNKPSQLPTFRPRVLHSAPKLKKYFQKNLFRRDSLNTLNDYAIFLPTGLVFLPEVLYNDFTQRKTYTTSYSITSSVQSVFVKGQNLYSYRDKENSFYTRHFIPLKQEGKVIAVVMLEAVQTATGVKMANAVSHAVFMTALSGIPVLILVVYLVWSRLKESYRAEQQIQFLSNNDKLTGLPNRTGYYESVEKVIRSKQGQDDVFAVFLLDLDGFHTINFELGDSVGDQILKLIVKRLKLNQPQSSIVTRLSGDEFAIILPDVSTGEQAASFAKKFKDELGLPYEVNGQEVVCTCSLGIVFAPDDGERGETLIKNAKLALYRAKEEGGNTFRFFEPDMDKELQEKRQLVKSLALALERDEFELYYQPQVELVGHTVTGYEALIRWNHPEKGLVSPVEFIPVLEENKMIIEVGEYVLKRACREALTWKNEEKVAVNLSTVQFEHQDVLQMVRRALEETGLPASRLELEITESVLMTDTESAIQLLSDLKALGVNIAMDDFGTGYSSLSYISQFEFDKIKIDRSFISSIQTDQRARAIITTIIGLGRALDILITAEGIETNEQLLLIQAAGGHLGQGYLFGKPLPLAEILALQEADLEEDAVRFANFVK